MKKTRVIIAGIEMDWSEENTFSIQLDSIRNVASALNYAAVDGDNLNKGFKIALKRNIYDDMGEKKGSVINFLKSQYGQNYISFSDMCKIHNGLTENNCKNKTESIIAQKAFNINLSLKNKKLFLHDINLNDNKSFAYKLKLVEEVKLQSQNKSIVVQSNLVRVTDLGELYLEQNYFLFRRNQKTFEV